MKARVKATNKIVDIYEQTLLTTFDSNDVRLDEVEFLEGDTNFTTDYWENLKHQYAGMAMQGILSNEDYCKVLLDEITEWSFAESVARASKDFATALIEKLKGE